MSIFFLNVIILKFIVEYEPEDAQLAARVETAHRQLGEVVARVVKQRKEMPELVLQTVKKQHQETQPRLEPMPDEVRALCVHSHSLSNTDACTVCAHSGAIRLWMPAWTWPIRCRRSRRTSTHWITRSPISRPRACALPLRPLL